MQTLQRPQWLLITQTLCSLLLIGLFYDAYDTIHTELPPHSILAWELFTIIWVFFSLISLGYALYCIRRREKLSLWYAMLLVVTQVLLLILLFVNYESLFPFTIPDWMIPDTMRLLGPTFLMPGIVHGMLILASRPSKKLFQETSFSYLVLAAVLPVLLYLGGMLFVMSDGQVEFLGIAAMLSFVVALTLLFSYAITRGLYLFAVKKAATLDQFSWITSLVLTLLLPLLGLLVNQLLYSRLGSTSGGIFGNFSHPATYVLTILNGLFLSLPTLRRPTLPFFLTRAALFSYSLYFLLVFLPFLPIAILAVLVLIGILMLAPIGVFVLHATRLTQDYTALRSRYPAGTLWLGGMAAFLLIPAAITGLFLIERHCFHEALDYVYTPDYHQSYQPDSRSVLHTLDYLKQHKNAVGFSTSTPYISIWYNRLVLGRQTLTDSRIQEMRAIFSATGDPENKPGFREDVAPPATAALKTVEAHSQYDETRRLWVSDLTLTLHNQQTSGSAEYTTDFELPAGGAISDYSLYINGRKEPGLLTEKKSALWVFNNIVNSSLDPGLLYYHSGNRMRLRVFPVAPAAERVTGLQLLHPEPVSFTIDGRTVQLGTPEASTSSPTIETPYFTRLSSAAVSRLPQRLRKPYFHFLIDAHEGNNTLFAAYDPAIRDLTMRFPDLAANAQLSLVSSVVQTRPYSASWATDPSSRPFSGGFFLQRALQQALVNSYEEGIDQYPVFIVCADSLNHAVLPDDFADLQFCVPEAPLFYHLLPSGRLVSHSLLKDSPKSVEAPRFPPQAMPVRVATNGGRNYYLPQTPAPAFILKKPLFKADSLQPNTETAALTLEALHRTALLKPEHTDAIWQNLVSASQKAHLLSPATAFIVVENEAQRQVLLKKQADMRSGKAALSAGEAEEDAERMNEVDDAERMSEPGTWIILGLLGIVLMLSRFRKKSSPYAA